MGRKHWVEMGALGPLTLRRGDALICLQREGELVALPSSAASRLEPPGSLKKGPSSNSEVQSEGGLGVNEFC